MSTERVPPGERPEDELLGSDAIAAMHECLVSITKPADKTLTVRDIDVRKVGRWVLMHVKLRHENEPIEFTVRMPRARAESIRLRLTRELR